MMNKPEMKSWITGSWSPVLTTGLGNSGSESDLMEEKKRRRKESNRESARKSRMKKQKHMEDLTAQLTQLRKENSQIAAKIAVTTEHYVAIEADNSVNRAQLSELDHRLKALNEIISFAGGFGMETGQGGGGGVMDYGGGGGGVNDGAMNPPNLGFYDKTPVMSSPSTGVGDVFNCW